MAEHIYNDVPVMIPEIKFLDPEMIDDEPWKMPFPVYSFETKPPFFFTMPCRELKYFMTDSRKALVEEMKKYNVKVPPLSNFRPNPALAHSVRLKMLELGVCWSAPKGSDSLIINYYTEEKGAFIAIL
ncbi:MAG: hypothetical protein IKT97_01860 [Spirochaetia bacterium]|jgi:hypothetical protein|nr:hypothetical protein [Spirochaetia bacterium]